MDETGVIVVGGGPVGAALALALDQRGFDVTLLEARAIANDDARSLALSYGSRLILERLGAWPPSPPPTAILEINVTQREGFGRLELSATDAGVPELGYVVEFGALQRALTAALAQSRVHIESGCAALSVSGDAQFASVTVEQAGARRDLHAKLVVVADGGASLELSQGRNHDYRQSALVCDISTEQPHRNRAFERFTDAGPLALLPHADGWALVWTATPERIAALAALNEKSFCEQLTAIFGTSLGEFTRCGRRQVFPLRLKVAVQPATPRCVLIGNAAQTLHPVAGQGFNLGLRDAFELARVMVAHGTDDPGSQGMLKTFFTQRRVDRTATILFTDSLIRLFSNDIPFLRPARGLGFAALSAIPAAKKFIARRMIFGARG